MTRVPKSHRPLQPLRVARRIPHHRARVQQHTRRVRPLHGRDLRAVGFDSSAIEDGVIQMAPDVANTHQPIPRLHRPVSVGLIAGVGEQSRSQVHEAGIGGRVLVVVAQIEHEDLPSQAAAAVLVVPSQLLAVPYSLCQRKPLRLIRRRVREFVLGRRHGRHAPEGLVVVALLLRHVLRHEVVRRPDLEHHPVDHEVVVAVVAGVVPVVHQRAEHCSAFPPVVWGVDQ